MAQMLYIDARAAWSGDSKECRRLYRQFSTTFRGKFSAIRAYYGWKRAPMLAALRLGRWQANPLRPHR